MIPPKGTAKQADALPFQYLLQLIQLFVTFTDNSDIQTNLSIYQDEYNIAFYFMSVNYNLPFYGTAK